MKKTMIALALAASAVSGMAHAWTNGDFNGSVDIGGSITADDYRQKWSWTIGSGLDGFNNALTELTNGGKSLTITVNGDKPILLGKTNVAFATLNQGMAVTAGRQEDGASVPAGMSLVSGQSVTDVQPGSLPQGVKNRLSALLLMNQNFGNGMNAVDNGQVINQGVLADGRVMNLAAAYASAVSDFELRLPAEGTPARWQAGLNVTVTVQ